MEDTAERLVERVIVNDSDPESAVHIVVTDKPGSPDANRQAILDKLAQGQDFFAQAYADWDGLTNAQKDARMKQAMRALANIARYIRSDYSGPGLS